MAEKRRKKGEGHWRITNTEYSCAAKPPVRKRGNRLSGRMETIVIPVWRSRLSGVA